MIPKARRYFVVTVLISIFLLLLWPDFSSCFAQENNNQKPVWLVVTRPLFVETLKPLVEKRRKDGFETVISTKPVSDAIKSLPKKPAFILLVGDCQSGMEKEQWYVPTRTCQTYRWRVTQEIDFASDAIWGDLNDDLIPDIAVGRLPVRTKEQLQLIVTKILKYESRPLSLNDLRVLIYTGSANYQPILDSMTTQVLLETINTNAAKWLRPWIVAANPTHPLCGWPEDQGQNFTTQLKAGGMMAVFMGHGSIDSFYGMEFNGKTIEYKAQQAAKLLSEGTPAPPALIIACYCGNFTASRNCLAESLLFLPAGPVATIGATTESHPMTNYFSGLCLLRRPGQTSLAEKRLGTLWLNAQLDAMKSRDIIIETLLLNIEGKLETKLDGNKLRRDHILMYALLGDPATELHMPETLECKIEPQGDVWHWYVDKPKGALKLFVEIRPAGQSMPLIELPFAKDSMQENLKLANDTFAFNTVSELNAKQAWEGTINTPGILRLVAFTPRDIYVFARKIELTNSPTARNIEKTN
jgi:hypothetical protein